MSTDQQATNALVERAKSRSNIDLIPEEWGYRVALEPDESFLGRWRGETVDEANANRRVFLLWDTDGERCFSRTYAALAREIDRVQPTVGCRIAVYRAEDYVGANGTGYSFGVEIEECDDPLPVEAASDSDLPF